MFLCRINKNYPQLSTDTPSYLELCPVFIVSIALNLSGPNPYEGVKKSLTVAGEQLQYFSLPALNDARYGM